MERLSLLIALIKAGSAHIAIISCHSVDGCRTVHIVCLHIFIRVSHKFDNRGIGIIVYEINIRLKVGIK